MSAVDEKCPYVRREFVRIATRSSDSPDSRRTHLLRYTTSPVDSRQRVGIKYYVTSWAGMRTHYRHTRIVTGRWKNHRNNSRLLHLRAFLIDFGESVGTQAEILWKIPGGRVSQRIIFYKSRGECVLSIRGTDTYRAVQYYVYFSPGIGGRDVWKTHIR